MKKSRFIIKNLKNNKKSYILPFAITASISFIISLILIVTISSIRYEFKYSEETFGNYDAEISNLNEDQIENIQNHISVGKFGEVLDTEEKTDIFSEFGYLKNYDKNAADMTGVEVISGKYPTNENEIAIEENSLDTVKKYALDKKYVKESPFSVKIPVFNSKGDLEYKIFKVVGLVNEKYENENWEKNIYVSKKYADKVGYKRLEFVKFKNIKSYDVRKIEKSLNNLIFDVGIEGDSVRVVSAVDYMKFTVLESFSMVAVLSIALILVSYIILKNINTSKLYREIKDMAILGAVGASSTQIKGIVRAQSFIISILAVTFGIGVNLFFIIIIKIINALKIVSLRETGMYSLLINISVNIKFMDILCIYLVVFLIVYLSYILSSMKTVKNMIKINIPEAIKNPNAIYTHNGRRKSNNKISIVIIFTIVSLCSVILKSIENENKNTYIDNVDFIVRMIDLNSDSRNSLSLNQIFSDNKSIEDIEQDISELDGVERVEKNYISHIKYNIDKNENIAVDLYCISDDEIEQLMESSKDGDFDLDAFKRGNGICIHRMYAKEYGIQSGDKLNLTVLKNGKEITKSFKVLNISQVSPDFGFIYSTALDKDISKNISSLKIECRDKKRESVKSEIEKIIEVKGSNLEFVDYLDEVDQSMTYLNAIKLVFGIICALAIILSIFNAINSSIYDIMSKSADFGILMAIGISDKQLEDMIFKKIKNKIIVPAIYGIAFGGVFVFLGSIILSKISTIKLEMSLPLGLYIFIFIVAYFSVKFGTKYVCNKMKKMSPTDIINSI